MGGRDRVHPSAYYGAIDALSYSIATGKYGVLKAFARRFREINAAVAVIAAAFLLKLIFA